MIYSPPTRYMFAAIARTHNFSSKGGDVCTATRFKRWISSLPNPHLPYGLEISTLRATFGRPMPHLRRPIVGRTATNDRCLGQSFCAYLRRSRRPVYISPCLRRARPRVTPRPEDHQPDRQMMASVSEHRLPTCLRSALGQTCSMPTCRSLFEYS